MAKRASEISAAVNAALARGFAVGMVTLTMRHHFGDELGELWQALSYAWGKATSGKQWLDDCAQVVGFVRAVEVTHGENGWHVHIHALMVLRDGSELDRIARGMFERWERAVVRKGFESPLLVGQDWHLIQGASDLGEYLCKAISVADDRIGLELTGSQTKDGKGGTRSPWAILEEFLQTGEAVLLRQWGEYELASFGRRQLTWTHGLRKLLLGDEEQTDEEIAGEELGTDRDTVAVLSSTGWGQVVREGWVTELLEVAELQGAAGLHEWLRERVIHLHDADPTRERAPHPLAVVRGLQLALVVDGD